MTKPMRALPLFAAAAFLVLGGGVAPGNADDDDNGDESEIPFDQAEIFINLNDTDEDLGFAAFIDGEGWTRLEIEGPNERTVFLTRVKGGLGRQGVTELAIESAEPNFDDLAPADFFSRFPEGPYEIEGKTLDGGELESTAQLTHVLPAPPDNITISGVPAAEDCDADPLPLVAAPITVSWDPVTQSHPEVGKPGAIEVIGYEVVVEREEPSLLIFSIDLPPTVTAVDVPAQFIDLGEEFKLEILVTEASGNRTAIETCFEVAG